jgi:hypothetical protein
LANFPERRGGGTGTIVLVARQQQPQQKPTTRMKEADKGIQGFLSPECHAKPSILNYLQNGTLNWLASSARKGNRRPTRESTF